MRTNPILPRCTRARKRKLILSTPIPFRSLALAQRVLTTKSASELRARGNGVAAYHAPVPPLEPTQAWFALRSSCNGRRLPSVKRSEMATCQPCPYTRRCAHCRCRLFLVHLEAALACAAVCKGDGADLPPWHSRRASPSMLGLFPPRLRGAAAPVPRISCARATRACRLVQQLFSGGEGVVGGRVSGNGVFHRLSTAESKRTPPSPPSAFMTSHAVQRRETFDDAFGSVSFAALPPTPGGIKRSVPPMVDYGGAHEENKVGESCRRMALGAAS